MLFISNIFFSGNKSNITRKSYRQRCKNRLVNFDGIPKYQDASFKIVLPAKKAGIFSIFGLGGISNILNNAKDSLDKISMQGDYGAKLGIIGVNHMFSFNSQTYIKSSFTLSGNGSNYVEDIKNRPIPEHAEGHMNKTSYLISSMISKKVDVQNVVIGEISYTNY